MIEFTEVEIRTVWSKLFKADVPDALTTKQIYEACLSTLGSEYLREELICLNR